LDESEIASNVRRLSGVAAGFGPDDKHIAAAVGGFVSQLEYWYIRVMRGAVPKYRPLIIARINPFIRRIEFEGLNASQTANRLVEDYNSRNFVTAGGWALEKMASTIGLDSQKSTSEGIDIQRYDPSTAEFHLYVLKSGLVTRNSDIVSALKRNARQAEKRLRQDKSTVRIVANWAIAAGKISSTFEDGIRRPSSAEFWAEMTGLPEDAALSLMLGVATEAGRIVRRDASAHIDAIRLLVANYIALPTKQDAVDWDFIARRNMRPKITWVAEDKFRHVQATALLESSGYVPEHDDAADDVDESSDKVKTVIRRSSKRIPHRK
jgi:type II restriction endonuclease EcoO109I-like protein